MRACAGRAHERDPPAQPASRRSRRRWPACRPALLPLATLCRVHPRPLDAGPSPSPIIRVQGRAQSHGGATRRFTWTAGSAKTSIPQPPACQRLSRGWSRPSESGLAAFSTSTVYASTGILQFQPCPSLCLRRRCCRGALDLRTASHVASGSSNSAESEPMVTMESSPSWSSTSVSCHEQTGAGAGLGGSAPAARLDPSRSPSLLCKTSARMAMPAPKHRQSQFAIPPPCPFRGSREARQAANPRWRGPG